MLFRLFLPVLTRFLLSQSLGLRRQPLLKSALALLCAERLARTEELTERVQCVVCGDTWEVPPDVSFLFLRSVVRLACRMSPRWFAPCVNLSLVLHA